MGRTQVMLRMEAEWFWRSGKVVLETMVVVDVAVGRRMLVFRVGSISRVSRVVLQEEMVYGIVGVVEHCLCSDFEMKM
jgi:hypothetical protein